MKCYQCSAHHLFGPNETVKESGSVWCTVMRCYRSALAEEQVPVCRLYRAVMRLRRRLQYVVKGLGVLEDQGVPSVADCRCRSGNTRQGDVSAPQGSERGGHHQGEGEAV